jgi:hypothetical protein
LQIGLFIDDSQSCAVVADVPPVELLLSLILGRRHSSSASLVTTAGNSLEKFLLLPGLPTTVPCISGPLVPSPSYSTGSQIRCLPVIFALGPIPSPAL